jgi:hypothetical protein
LDDIERSAPTVGQDSSAAGLSGWKEGEDVAEDVIREVAEAIAWAALLVRGRHHDEITRAFMHIDPRSGPAAIMVRLEEFVNYTTGSQARTTLVDASRKKEAFHIWTSGSKRQAHRIS